MGSFTDNITVKITDNKEKPYTNVEEYEFHSGRKNSGLFVRARVDFQFNGTSIPWFLRWLISPSDPALLQCAGIHDQLFEDGVLIIRVEGIEDLVPIVDRRIANAIMAEMMKAKKVIQWKQTIVNVGLAIGSKSVWEACRKDQVTAFK